MAFITLKFRTSAKKHAYRKLCSSAASSPVVSPRSRTRAAPRSSAAITKSSDDRRQSLKLTVKAPPSKLREVMRANEVQSLHDVLGGGQVIEGRRRRAAPPPRSSTRAAGRQVYTEVGESDIEDEDDDDVEKDDDDNDLDDEDEDVEMEDAPVPPKAPKITLKPPAKTSGSGNTKIIVQPPNVGQVKSVEDQEMQDDPGDDEVDNEDGEQEDDDDSSSDQDSEIPGSGAATPDPTKMTKRQRRAFEGEEFMALEMGPQQRKFFTDEEKAMKKDEHARKRKELTKRKVQEEKNAALNRLLKPQASKARGAAPKPETLLALEKAGEGPMEEEAVEKPNPLYTRWISTKNGVRLGVPDEWLGKQAGRMFGPPRAPTNGNLPPSNGALVQELPVE
ncbi:uncharacterized protein AB675_6731 [Cyphellophora attinorum]|uniref:INO80 complex subunit B-like conserved region domain-containing protein n=1 Tax=Cyphellophora attinorum TaxID=1664694 RepID=A0A0N0NQ63_9EURO|nr:uncharacterized protein AB675_6731 [Phialophora attinorum]KPI43541.1 hypothetical protein AB675_6731 [Phialophora attinorum]